MQNYPRCPRAFASSWAMERIFAAIALPSGLSAVEATGMSGTGAERSTPPFFAFSICAFIRASLRSMKPFCIFAGKLCRLRSSSALKIKLTYSGASLSATSAEYGPSGSRAMHHHDACRLFFSAGKLCDDSLGIDARENGFGARDDFGRVKEIALLSIGVVPCSTPIVDIYTRLFYNASRLASFSSLFLFHTSARFNVFCWIYFGTSISILCLVTASIFPRYSSSVIIG